MTSKPILRVGKIKATGRSTPQSVGGHLARSRPTPNADPARTSRNRWLIGSAELDLDQAIGEVMASAGIDRAALRKDATIANDVLLTVSPEWFRPDEPTKAGAYDDARVQAFAAEAESLLRKTFGARLVCAVLHLDEATPHIQAVLVPIMKGKTEGKRYRLSGKDMFNPETLTQLQQDWEDRMRKHGVGPRTKGSRARHTTLREYYGALEATRAIDGRSAIQLPPPPQKGLLEGQKAYQERFGQWEAAVGREIDERTSALAVEASRGRLYDSERRSNVAMRTELASQAGRLADAYVQMGLDQEAIDALRRTPINEVAAALGWTDPITTSNAIDLVKLAGELNYQQAVAWLAQRFDADLAATAVREHALPLAAAAADAAPVVTKAERAKAIQVRKQLDALAAPGYRITVMTERDGESFGKNLGKRPEGGEEFYSRDQVVAMIPRLIGENARGGNVYVTPIDRGVRHVLVDDLSPSGLEELERRGYAPAAVMETSPSNFQAVLKVPADLPKEDVNEWFKDLNRDVGDPRITGLSHGFRLAGFQNRKAKHETPEGQFPFVRLHQAVNRICRRAIEVVQSYTARRTSTDAEHRTLPRL